MTKGIPSFRNENVRIATNEAKRYLLETKSWEKTKDHMKLWIKRRFSLAARTTKDYIDDIYARLSIDREVSQYVR